MVRQAELIKYLPQFLREYEEIKRLTDAENPEFQALFNALEKLRNDLFVLSCSANGIERFENLLGISSDSRESLETRISRVLMRLNDFIPITFKTLIDRMDVICGSGNYELLPDWNNYFLKIITRFDVYGQTDDFKRLIEEIIPANLRLEFENILILSLCNFLCGGGFVSCCELVELSDSQPQDKISISISPTTGGFLSCCEMCVI